MIPKGETYTKVVEMRTKNRCATLQEIGDKYSITKERVRQILNKAGLPTHKFVQHYQCSKCGVRIQINKTGFCSKCKHEYNLINITCSECGVLFARQKAEIIKNRHQSNRYFCSKRCQGKFAARNWGFVKGGRYGGNRPPILTLEIQQLLKQGYTPAEIIKLFGYRSGTVYLAKNKMGKND